MKVKQSIRCLLVALVLVGITAGFLGFGGAGPAMVVSVSSDGRFVISSHRDQKIILWDIQGREREVIATDANIYSAYFIQGRHAFLWQGLDNVVHVETVEGKTLKRFETFPTYGHVMTTDLQHYFASDKRWNLYAGYGANQQPVKQDGESPSFVGQGKLLNLSLSKSGDYLLSAGRGLEAYDRTPIAASAPVSEGRFSDYAGVVLWNVDTLEPVAKLPGNASKTIATFSPDGRWVLSADEGGVALKWSTAAPHQPAIKLEFAMPSWTGDGFLRGLKGLPEDYDTHNGGIQTLKFISEDHYLKIFNDEPYAFLYRLGTKPALRYFRLGREPYPSVDSYPRNAAIDTAPAAGILVTGQREGGGINVYRYDAEAQTLDKIWTPG